MCQPIRDLSPSYPEPDTAPTDSSATWLPFHPPIGPPALSVTVTNQPNSESTAENREQNKNNDAAIWIFTELIKNERIKLLLQPSQ